MNIIDLYQNNKTVFTRDELSQLFPTDSVAKINSAIYYAVKTGKILRLRRGIYGKSEYSTHELANKLYTPSYVSLETILNDHGVIFQSSNAIQSVSYLTRTTIVNGVNLVYRKIDYPVLINPIGIETKNNASSASLERAFLDAMMIFKDYHFDNLRPIDWDKVATLLPIYNSKILTKRVLALQGGLSGE